jgi:outer membrane receptor protein involved in Fe transport
MNSGILGLISRDIRGERSGLNNSFLRTFYLQNEFKPNDKLSLLSRIVYRETGTADNSYVYLTLDGSKLIRAILASYSNRVSGELTANYKIRSKQNFSAGVQYFRDDVEQGNRRATIDTTNIYLIDGRDTLTNLYSTFLPRLRDIRNNFGSYLQYVINTNLLKSTSFTVGGRYDYNSYFGSAISPRLAIVNTPTDKLTLKFQYGRAFRAPTNTEIYQAPSNFTLETEKIRTYEVNAIYVKSTSLRFQLNAFRNLLTDVIVLGNLSGFEPDKNPGEVKVAGLEGVVDFSPAKNTACFINVTYQDARGKNLVTGLSRQSSGIARIKGNLGVTYTVEELFNITLSGNWVGKRNVVRTDPYGTVAGYFLTNCVVSTKELFHKGITASINVQNIFNTKWLDPGFRTADGFLYSTVLEQPGINGMFKVGIRF